MPRVVPGCKRRALQPIFYPLTFGPHSAFPFHVWNYVVSDLKVSAAALAFFERIEAELKAAMLLVGAKDLATLRSLDWQSWTEPEPVDFPWIDAR